jgi:ABC-type sugar transport system permease subunit
MATNYQKKEITTVNWRKFWTKYGMGYLFVLPALLLFFVFVISTFVNSVYYSLTDWNGASPVKVFVGLGNYAKLLQDDIFWLCLQHNAIWMVVGTIVPIFLGLFLAVLIWRRPRGFIFFRTVFFLPQVLGAGILGILWVMILRYPNGLIPTIGATFNIDFLTYGVLGSFTGALCALLGASIWSSVGFFFVIMVAALQNVNMELIDAAQVDGANSVQSFIYVLVPQLTHTITLVTVLAVIGGLNTFGLIYAVTQGGPANGTQVIATYAFRTFAVLSRVGYSATITTVMSIIAISITVVFINIRERQQG